MYLYSVHCILYRYITNQIWIMNPESTESTLQQIKSNTLITWNLNKFNVSSLNSLNSTQLSSQQRLKSELWTLKLHRTFTGYLGVHSEKNMVSCDCTVSDARNPLSLVQMLCGLSDGSLKHRPFPTADQPLQVVPAKLMTRGCLKPSSHSSS